MSDRGSRNISRRFLANVGANGVLALVFMPILAACSSQQKMDDGATQRTGGQNPPAAGDTTQSEAKKKAKRDAAAAAAKKDEEEKNDADARPAKPSESDADADTLGSEASGSGSREQLDSSAEPESGSTNVKPQTVAGLRGAKPDGGFFNSGAPELTLAQIQAGQAVNGVCEGGLHQLVIEPQHLAALARGESVSVKSSTHTHLGNPTVHDHSVTYRPIIG